MSTFIPHRRRVLLILATAIVSAGWGGRADAIDLNRADRFSIHPTEPTEVTFRGNDLRSEGNTPARIWTSYPATVEVVESDGKPDRNRVRYRITPHRQVDGVVVFRAFTKDAISKPLLMLADASQPRPVPTMREEIVTIPATLESTSQGLGSHVIAIECKKGEPFLAELVAARAGSEMDGVLILRDQDQREITFADDHGVTGADPILAYTPTYDGVHYLVVRDVEYRGGLPYQLRLSDRSFSSCVFPPAVRLGETRQFASVPVALATDESESLFTTSSGPWLGMGYLGQGSIAPALHTNLPVYVEGGSEPLPMPSLFCGRIGSDNESDRISFVALAGERIAIDVHSDSLGSPIVPTLELQRADDSLVAAHNWAQDSGGMIRAEINESGTYRITISDVLHRGGPHFSYAVAIRNDVAPFSLKLLQPKKRKGDPNRFVTSVGEPIDVSMRIERRGYDGPIRITARTEDGMTCQVTDADVKEKANEANVQVTLPVTVDEPSLRHFQLTGECEIEGRRYVTPLDFTEFIWKDIPKLRTVPGCVACYLPVVISPADGDDVSPPSDAGKED